MKNPDAYIKNEYYEFKTPKSYKGIDSRVKEGLIQVEKNNGNLVLDVKNCSVPVKKMIELVQHRVHRSLKNKSINILLINTETNELINQAQYKK